MTVSPEGFTCPVPISTYSQVLLGHGSGGTMSARLISDLFVRCFDNPVLRALNDQAIVEFDGMRIAITTDSFVVSPLFFPGGDIGSLAVNGTVNDLAVGGAKPMWMAAAFILEEGLPMADLEAIVRSASDAAAVAGVTLVTGDTKVVDRGKGDGVFITTTGVGIVPSGVDLSADRCLPGDRILISGPIGVHGIAVMSAREGIEFETDLRSDSAALGGLVDAMLAASKGIRCMRDPTRGGVSSALNELACASGVGMILEERALVIPEAVRAACEMLGLDPLYVANEGVLIAVVAPESADGVLAAMRTHALGEQAVIAGTVVAEHPGTVAMRSGVGGTRVVDMLAGEQLPRIC
ncbi:MAG: hydrogenase expression/formation protein HypE [Actinomycetota bacterium]